MEGNQDEGDEDEDEDEDRAEMTVWTAALNNVNFFDKVCKVSALEMAPTLTLWTVAEMGCASRVCLYFSRRIKKRSNNVSAAKKT